MRRYRPSVNGGPGADDWFASTDAEVPDGPSEENVDPRADDWLSEVDRAPQRQSWAGAIDRRVVAVSASLLVLLIAGLAAGGVFSGGGGGGAKAPSSTPPPTASTPAATGTTTTTPATRRLPAPATTLKPGDTGTQVEVLQRGLASLGFSAGKVDGKYGPATKNAVAQFQASAHLTADGIVGPLTLRALVSALRGP